MAQKSAVFSHHNRTYVELKCRIPYLAHLISEY